MWGFNGEGLAEDRSGTSQAAPLLAREAALTLAALRAHCATGTQPFGVTARAFLALTAKRTSNDSSVAALAARTLGLGLASSAELTTPRSGAAIVLWQGIVENSRDVLRVQFPIPRAWLKAASSPVLRMMVSYDPPVNEAATALWACRAVKVTLHTSPDARGITGSHRLHRTYPLFLKEFKLAKFAPGAQNAAGTDLWILEVAYDEIFDYPPGMTFDARQRVALAAELVDVGANPVDPQPAMQALPAVATMNRLSVQQTPLRVPLIVRTR